MGLACDLLGLGCAPRRKQPPLGLHRKQPPLGLRGSDTYHAQVAAGAGRIAADGLTEAIRAARKGKTRWECKAAYDKFMEAVYAAGQSAGNAEAIDAPTAGKAERILTDPGFDYMENTFKAKREGKYPRATANKLLRSLDRLMLQAEGDIRKCFLRVAKSRAAGAAILED